MDLIDELRADGFAIERIGTEWPSMPDPKLVELAEQHSRIILTLDKDIKQIAMQRRQPLQNGGVVLFRAHPATPSGLRPVLLFFRNADRLWIGRVTTLTLMTGGQISVQQS